MTISHSRKASLRLEVGREDVHLPGMLEDIPTLFERWGLNKEPQECIWVVAYSADLAVRNVVEVARGSHIKSNLHLPTMLAAVLTAGCERFLLVHNHPSNDPTPSKGDIELTKVVMEAANAAGLYFEDHFILAPSGRFRSFRLQGMMKVPDYEKHAQAASNVRTSR